MINLNKLAEAILQNVERFVGLVLEPFYKNMIIYPTMDSSVSQQ